VSRTGLAKLPLLPTFPIVAILRRVMFPADDDNAASTSAADEARAAHGSKEMVGLALPGVRFVTSWTILAVIINFKITMCEKCQP
jgi:hypothetical protein